MCTDFTTEFVGLPSFQISSWEKASDSLWILYLDPVESQSFCPVCKQGSVNHANPGRRLLRHRFIPSWGSVSVSIPIIRKRCNACSITWTLEWDGIPPRGKATDDFRLMCVNSCNNRDLLSVSKEIGVSYTTLERWFYQEAPNRLAKPEESTAPQVVCLDEFALQKGHRYGLHLMDAISGHVWQITEGRSRKQIQMALQSWPFAAFPKVVVTDLAPGMATSVKQIWKETEVVADKFHVIQLFSKYLEKARKRSHFQGTHRKGRHEQRLLHTQPSKLKPEELDEISTWLNSDPDLLHVYQALQDIRAVYESVTLIEGKLKLKEWIEKHLYSTCSALRSVAKTIVQWRKEIEAYFTHRYTNARIEGKHNRIKVIKRRAYGYRNIERFSIRIRLECRVT